MNRWPVTIELPVQWGDMDSFGHVNNIVYLRWFESARIAYFEKAGILSQMPDIGPIQARQVIDYRLPLTYPDRLLVSATVTKLGNTSFTMLYQVVSERRGLVAEGEGIVVMFDYAKQAKTPLDEGLRARIATLEGRDVA